jgi:hypothetical protein
MVHEVPPVQGLVSDQHKMKIARTYVGKVLSTYIIALMPVIKIASRPTQPAARSSYELSLVRWF